MKSCGKARWKPARTRRLREGTPIDYLDRHGRGIRESAEIADVRRRSVVRLLRRLGQSDPHNEHVARLALRIFDQLRDDLGLEAEAREWLEFAALLHDVGILISYERHHRHAYYLIKNGDLRGFDPDEIEIIALTARYHRRGTPKKSHQGFANLRGPQRRAVKWLSALLRLAEGLDRSRAQAVTGVDVYDRGEDYLVRLRSGGDAELEVRASPRRGPRRRSPASSSPARR